MDEAATTATGTLTGIRFRKQETGFVIAQFLSPDRKPFVALGNMARPEPDLDYELRGAWQEDPRFGRQFRFNEYRTLRPQDENGLCRYILRVCKGVIGVKVAERLVQRWPTEAVERLKQDPAKTARCIKGLARAKAEKAADMLREYEEVEEVLLALEGLLAVPGMRKSAAWDVFQAFGASAVHKLEENPYVLTEVDGIGFRLADRVALKMGHAPTSPFRQAAALLHVLKENEGAGGHTWMDRDEARREAGGLVPECASVDEGLNALLETGRVARDGGVLAHKDTARAEELIARKIVRLDACAR